jgi:hypothetical protein
MGVSFGTNGGEDERFEVTSRKTRGKMNARKTKTMIIVFKEVMSENVVDLWKGRIVLVYVSEL